MIVLIFQQIMLMLSVHSLPESVLHIILTKVESHMIFDIAYIETRQKSLIYDHLLEVFLTCKHRQCKVMLDNGRTTLDNSKQACNGVGT